MTSDFTPLLHPVEIASLRPTQMTVGFAEVHRKREEWRTHATRDPADFLGRHMIPAVLGPKERHFIIDHHHLVRALHAEGVSHVLVSLVADLSDLKTDLFWTFMDNCNWLHPFDAEGRRHDYDKIPHRIEKLEDDPYRSLAGAVRRAGGYAKEAVPYSEFLWAEFLRRRIGRKLLDRDFEAAVLKAQRLAHSHDARYLPGWCGPSS